LVKLVGEHDHVVSIEDGLVEGGIGTLLAAAAARQGVHTPVQAFGIPRQFLAHASREQLIDQLHLGPHEIAGEVLAALAAADRPTRQGLSS
jgi:1-deoxy-D-xylulose-5-phosphate synthase